MSQGNADNTFSLLFLFDVIRKYLLYIAGVVVLACIIAFVLTLPFFYPPEYKSSAIIYPTSPERYDLATLFHYEPDIYVFGQSKEAEKLVSIAEMRKLKLEIIDSLNLWPLYGVDKWNDESPEHYALLAYDGYISVGRISGDGVEITALDMDPQRAADIVNLVADKIDLYNRKMYTENKNGILEMYEDGIYEIERRMWILSDSARKVRKQYGVFRSLTQTERMIEAAIAAEGEYAQAFGELEESRRLGAGRSTSKRIELAGLENKVKALTTNETNSSLNLEKFREGIDRIMTLEEQITRLSEELGNNKKKVEYLKMMGTTNFSSIMMPERALPSDKKARPVRWMILLTTFMIATLVAILGAALIDKITEISENKTEEEMEPTEAKVDTEADNKASEEKNESAS
ncbi:MAG: Wzz/FepE/Etk N-terminal domain-containing protein [Bacteroidota bacterium]